VRRRVQSQGGRTPAAARSRQRRPGSGRISAQDPAGAAAAQGRAADVSSPAMVARRMGSLRNDPDSHLRRGRANSCQQRQQGPAYTTEQSQVSGRAASSPRGSGVRLIRFRASLRWFLAWPDPAPCRPADACPHQWPERRSGHACHGVCGPVRRHPDGLDPQQDCLSSRSGLIRDLHVAVRECVYRPRSISATASAPPHRAPGHRPDSPSSGWRR